MTSMTWTNASADLLGQGGAAVRPCTGIDVAVSPALRAPVAGTLLPVAPVAGPAVRLRRPATAARTEARTHNYIDTQKFVTTLGIHSSRRPQS
jgi:hypothetical protein